MFTPAEMIMAVVIGWLLRFIWEECLNPTNDR